eukprot:TRINITY_DN1158_c0_g1_i1.p1 TRINITY_DN1158_c0_g1~~TRINITY_DN1158_c0_g1_i1.p1  ORF type:complete len:210 (-),score=65.70 TRINITY_DN1158_c0_g1_i1:414-1043(-)
MAESTRLSVNNCEGATTDLQGLANPFALPLQVLETNPPDVYQTAARTLSLLLQNVVTHPESEKHRTLHLSNKAIQARVLSAEGALEFLAACGFVQVEDTLVFVEDVTLVENALRVLQAAVPAPVPAPPPPAPQQAASVDPARVKWLAEQKQRKQQEESERAAIRARIAGNREEQKYRVVTDSKAALIKGQSKGTVQNATQMGLDGKAGG